MTSILFLTIYYQHIIAHVINNSMINQLAIFEGCFIFTFILNIFEDSSVVGAPGRLSIDMF